MKNDRTYFPTSTGLCYNNLHYNILNFLRSINHLVHHSVVFLLSYLLINIPRLPSSYQRGTTWSAHIL